MTSFRSILFEETNNSIAQIIRNAVVEFIRYCTNQIILFILIQYILGEENLAISTAIASILAGLVNYALSSLWVFHKTEKKVSKNVLQFALFTAIGAIGLGINVGITTLLTKQCGIYFLVSSTIAQIIVFFFNFFMRKYLVFERNANAKESA